MSISIVGNTLYQYDLNRTVSITGDANEAHWKQDGANTALRTLITNGVAPIPNILLLSSSNIKCWAYDSVKGITIEEKTFAVYERQQPADYVYTETDAVKIEDFVNDYMQENPVGWDGVADKPDTFPPSSHDHDGRYYTETEVDTLFSQISSSNHDHDDRYYTETEADILLGGKSDSSHTHDDRYYTKIEEDTKFSGKSDTTHTHDDIYNKTEVNTLLGDKSDSAHTHAASDVSLIDSGEYYSGASAEEALQEIGATLNVIATGLSGL